MHLGAGGERVILRVLNQGKVEGRCIFERAPHNGARGDAPPVVGDADRAGVLEIGHFGERLPLLADRNGPDGVEARPADRAKTAALVSREHVVDWVSGACLLVRRQAALDAGLLDEHYFMYEEDVDFCAALRARGGKRVFAEVAALDFRLEPVGQRMDFGCGHGFDLRGLLPPKGLQMRVRFVRHDAAP